MFEDGKIPFALYFLDSIISIQFSIWWTTLLLADPERMKLNSLRMKESIITLNGTFF